MRIIIHRNVYWLWSGWILLAGTLISCQHTHKQQGFGEPFTVKNSVSLSSAISGLKPGDSTRLTFVGEVNEVCQVKGCWMSLKDDQVDLPIRVTFKDYAFFVPKDLAGQEVVIHGTATVKTLSEAMARHYAEDAGQLYDSTRLRELSVVATGVVVIKKE